MNKFIPIEMEEKKELSGCYLCGGREVFDFFSMPPVPTQDGIMCSSEEEAQSVAKGSINLRFCKKCGFIGNEGYESGKISFGSYDFSNDHSPLFRAYNEQLCDRLIENYDLRGKTILDIGCGDGQFLQTICRKGCNRGIGIDSGFDHSKRKTSDEERISFIKDYYSEKYQHLKADFIACRLVIDLLGNPIGFLQTLRKNLENQPNTILYFEVPNARYTFEEMIIWNVVYEHRSWFTPNSLAYLFEITGFEVLNVMPCWKDEFLGIEARPNLNSANSKLPNLTNLRNFSRTIDRFGAGFLEQLSKSEVEIERIKKEEIKTLAWGAGARGVTFFNLFNLKKVVPYIVDINVKRQGKYLPGSGQKIVKPEFAVEYQPDLIIITNPTYAEEIKEQVCQLGISPEFWVL